MYILEPNMPQHVRLMYSCTCSSTYKRLSNLRQTTYFPHLKIYLGPFLDGDTLFEKGPYVPPTIMKK